MYFAKKEQIICFFQKFVVSLQHLLDGEEGKCPQDVLPLHRLLLMIPI